MKQKLSLLAICLLLLWGDELFAQFENTYVIDYDTNYIKDHRHRLNLSLITDFRNSSLSVLTPDGKLANYFTNLPVPTYGAFVSYRWLNAGISLPIRGLSYLPPDRGESSSQNFALGITSRRWYFRNTLDIFEGYYNSNPQVFDPDYFLTNSQLPVVESMRSTTLFSSFNFVWNGDKYSHRSLMFQSEFQKKSAGSMLFGASAIGRWVYSDEVITTRDTVDVYSVNYAFIGFNFGYVYTWALWRHLNLSAMLLPGVNYSMGAYNTTFSASEEPFLKGVGVHAEARFQVLYQLDNFFTGLAITSYSTSNISGNQSPLAVSNNFLRFNLGYRFKMKPIKILKPYGLSN